MDWRDRLFLLETDRIYIMRRIKTGDLRNVFGEKFVLGVMTGAVVDSVSLSVVGAAGMWLGVSAAIL